MSDERDPIGEDGLPDGRHRLYMRRIIRPERWTEISRELSEYGIDPSITGSWPLTLAENVPMMVVITEDLHRAGYTFYRGGGFDENDAVRELLAIRERMQVIASQHHANGRGRCAECQRKWPCATYDWARENSDRTELQETSWNRGEPRG